MKLAAGRRGQGRRLAARRGDDEMVDAQEKGTSATTRLPDPDPSPPGRDLFAARAPNEIAVTVASSGADPRLFAAGTNGTPPAP